MFDTAIEQSDETDALTGLLSREAWHRRLKYELLQAGRTGRTLSVVLIDLDEFEAFNDANGREAGDRVLKELGAAWSRHVRGTDIVGRFGDDEFALLLLGCGVGDAHEILERLRNAVPGDTTCSMGIAEWDRRESAERLLLRADEALYSAKRQGRDRVAS